jgi:hypothetical protein
MITATPCLLTYHHEPGVSDPSRLLRAPSTDYAKALEDIGSGHRTFYHTSLDNGAAGCGFFLHDLYIVTGATKYQLAAMKLASWIRTAARTDDQGIWWYDYLDTKTSRWINPREMSWHWGQAGIIAYLSRLSGWKISMPVEEQSILPFTPTRHDGPRRGSAGR